MSLTLDFYSVISNNLNTKGLHHLVAKMKGFENLSLWQRLNSFLRSKFSYEQKKVHKLNFDGVKSIKYNLALK